MTAPQRILDLTDAQLAAMPVKPNPVYLAARLPYQAWQAHEAKISGPITAGGVTFDPGANFEQTLAWLGHSYSAAKNSVVTSFLWVHDDGSTQNLTAVQLIAIRKEMTTRLRQGQED
jgi:hypothetical protein